MIKVLVVVYDIIEFFLKLKIMYKDNLINVLLFRKDFKVNGIFGVKIFLLY